MTPDKDMFSHYADRQVKFPEKNGNEATLRQELKSLRLLFQQ